MTNSLVSQRACVGVRTFFKNNFVPRLVLINFRIKAKFTTKKMGFGSNTIFFFKIVLVFITITENPFAVRWDSAFGSPYNQHLRGVLAKLKKNPLRRMVALKDFVILICDSGLLCTLSTETGGWT